MSPTIAFDKKRYPVFPSALIQTRNIHEIDLCDPHSLPKLRSKNYDLILTDISILHNHDSGYFEKLTNSDLPVLFLNKKQSPLEQLIFLLEDPESGTNLRQLFQRFHSLFSNKQILVLSVIPIYQIRKKSQHQLIRWLKEHISGFSYLQLNGYHLEGVLPFTEKSSSLLIGNKILKKSPLTRNYESIARLNHVSLLVL